MLLIVYELGSPRVLVYANMNSTTRVMLCRHRHSGIYFIQIKEMPALTMSEKSKRLDVEKSKSALEMKRIES